MTTRILCAGTFDSLHTGHIKYFNESKKLARDSYLTIIVSRDSNSEKIKNKPTINNEDIRLQKIKDLNIADEVVLGYKGNRFIDRIIDLNPDIIALGHDQWAKEDWLEEQLASHNKNIKIVRMPKYDKEYL